MILNVMFMIYDKKIKRVHRRMKLGRTYSEVIRGELNYSSGLLCCLRRGVVQCNYKRDLLL